ncbi:glutamine amidotransferase [Acuticoccus kandeliae]|uniref:glutamine amidotransferase n=1 Tax=Acuticoccus kandeliae TaxID=2073160 RepID=UPI000D3EB4F6|nr:glutamine amidotransferase [Acuticoccus kandeliae]
MTKVLLAGESWMTHSIHVKGFDSFTTSAYHEGGTEMIAAMRAAGLDVTYQPAHIAADHFPLSAEALAAYDVVILSDIGANTLLMPDRTFARSEPTPNRLRLIADFVKGGGGLLMVGGYLTFQGIEGKAAYAGTPVDDVLPVALMTRDDRSERPEGVVPAIVNGAHPVMAGLTEWPTFLGYNRSMLREDATLLAEVDGDPFIAVRTVGSGRSAIFASDCGPHWGPPAFLAWPGYGPLWANLCNWLAG